MKGRKTKKMRKLYEINADIENLLNSVTDPETGEVVDTDCLDDLFMEREQKIENVALYCKDVDAEIVAISHEIMIQEKRVERLKKTYEGLKQYLATALDGQKFSTAKCEVSFRKSESADVDPEFIEWASDINNCALHFIKRKETVTADKAAIKKFLKSGGTLEHCRIVENKNMTIK